MSRLGITAIVLAVAGTALLAPSAEAAPICRGAAAAGSSVFVCVVTDAGVSGTTVAPSFYICPIINGSTDACTAEPTAIGATGFVPDPNAPAPHVDIRTQTVSFAGGTIGRLMVAGTPIPVNVPPFCVGDPAVC